METNDFRIDDFLPYLLARAADEASARFEKVYKQRFGLLRTDWRVLFHLGTSGRMAARDIVRRVGEDKTRISRSVARLELLGYLSRQRDPSDRRSELLELTDDGRSVYDELRAEAAAHDAQLVAQIGAEEIAHLRRTLGRLALGDPSS